MIDLRRLADDPAYRVGIERKRVAPGLLDEVIALDARVPTLDNDVQALRARQNAASKEIGRASADERPAKIEAAARLKEELGAAEAALTELEPEVRALALQVPNPADASVPDGGEDEGEVVRTVGTLPAAPPAADHATFAEQAGWVDRERAAEIAGSRFAYLMGDAVLLEFALLQWVLGKVVAAGYTPVVPPVLVRERTMEEAGFFPTDRGTGVRGRRR